MSAQYTLLSDRERFVFSKVDEARNMIAQARESDPTTRSVLSTCEAEGLYEVDQLRMLCANLLWQHRQATDALLNMQEKINRLEKEIASLHRTMQYMQGR